jgi:hypothetical protein
MKLRFVEALQVGGGADLRTGVGRVCETRRFSGDP